jgi:hypothetical protein
MPAQGAAAEARGRRGGVERHGGGGGGEEGRREEVRRRSRWSKGDGCARERRRAGWGCDARWSGKMDVGRSWSFLWRERRLAADVWWPCDAEAEACGDAMRCGALTRAASAAAAAAAAVALTAVPAPADCRCTRPGSAACCLRLAAGGVRKGRTLRRCVQCSCGYARGAGHELRAPEDAVRCRRAVAGQMRAAGSCSKQMQTGRPTRDRIGAAAGAGAGAGSWCWRGCAARRGGRGAAGMPATADAADVQPSGGAEEIGRARVAAGARKQRAGSLAGGRGGEGRRAARAGRAGECAHGRKARARRRGAGCGQPAARRMKGGSD